MNNVKCAYGCGCAANFFMKNGKGCCSKNVSSCQGMKEKNRKSKVGINPFANREHPRGNAGKIAWNKGLTKYTNESVAKCAASFSQSIQSGKYVPHRTPHTEEMKNYLSNKMHDRYSAGWEPTCGRCKKYDYDSPIAGKVKLDGTWEVKVAIYLDSIGVKWKRNKIRFNYIRPDGKSATYQPDFHIEDWDTYLEVKGYETELDRAKWSQFTEPLLIWKKKEIQNLGNVSDGV